MMDIRTRSRTLARFAVASHALLVIAIVVSSGGRCAAARLDELSLDRWARLREVERYQLNIAEKYYREKNFKVAAAEYEKFLTLYETSEAAAYSQLKWSLCNIQLRKHNTAIKEGYQSVIDYWPDSPEAISSQYYIGRAYKDIGEIRKAKKAYEKVLSDHADHLAAVYSTVDLIDITTIDEDVDERVRLWKRLAFDTKRTRETDSHCVKASQQYATHAFEFGSFTDGVKGLQTTYGADEISDQISAYARGPVARLVSKQETRTRGEQLADEGVNWIRQQLSSDRSSDEAKATAKGHWYAMADLQIASGREDKVAEIYGQLVSALGTDDQTLQRIGDWYKSVDKFDKARQQFLAFADKTEGLNQIALSYRQQQNYTAAVEAYQRNAAADTENSARWSAEVAATYRDAGKYAEAIAAYQELLKNDAENAEQWMWMIAASHRDAGQHKEAIGYYRQSNNFPRNYQEMASCHRAMKEFGEAVILYNQIVGGAPKSAAWAMLQIGYTHEQAGKKESAIRSFQQVCRNYPKDRYASQAHAHLQSKYKITVTLGGATDK